MNQTAILEKIKRFWDNRPCNIRHSSKEVGTLEYFAEVRERRYFVEPHIKRFVEFENWKGKDVLEIGCGIGTDSVEFALSGARVTAVELSPKSLEIARRRFEVYGLQGEFIEVSAEELSKKVRVRPYDLIYSFGVIHHTPNPEKVFEEIKKYCRQNTQIKIMLYAKWSWKMLWIVLKFGRGKFWKWKELASQYSEAQEGSPVTYVYSFKGIRKLFKDFEILKMEKFFIFPYKINGYRNYNYVKNWYFRWMPEWLFNWLQRKLGWHLLITARQKPI